MKVVPALVFALVLVGAAHAADTTRYIVLVNGGKDKAGHLTMTRNGDECSVDYIFKDNGRGPELKEEYTLAADGTFARYEVKGVSTFGSEIGETFSRSGDTVRWKSTSDMGEQAVSGTAQYTPLGGTPQAMSVALAALAKRPDGKLPLIPDGVLTARKLLDVEVSRGAEKRQVRLLAVTGIGFTPITVWATADATPRLFADISPGYMQLVEQGWEQNAADLETRQVAAEKELLTDLNKRLSHSLSGTTFIRNARVFDSERARHARARERRVHREWPDHRGERGGDVHTESRPHDRRCKPRAAPGAVRHARAPGLLGWRAAHRHGRHLGARHG
jgi:hypothetical protein